MSKGLKLTLVTVAVALMGMSAMAEAPVIADIPSPIVGGGPTISPSDTFVYPDAINLNLYVSDDGGLENVVYSYAVEGTAIYNLNGTGPLDLLADDPIDPAATSKDLGTIRNSELDPDAKVQSLTVRNVNLSPYGGPDTDPVTTGLLSSEEQVVTLFASDGSTYTTQEIMVYTDNGGQDRLSPAPTGEIVINYDFTNDDNGFVTTAGFNFGTRTVTVGANGVCIEVIAGGTNIGTWTSPYPMFEMAGNSVYRVRANVNSTQTTAGAVPLWDIVIQNFDNITATQGANAYLADYLYLDNVGGAYAVGPATGIDNIELYFVPLAAKCPAWTDVATGAFSTANDARNDVQLIFRILDADNTGGFGGESDFGQICMQTLLIERFNLTEQVAEGDTVMDIAIGQPAYRGYDLLGSTSFNWTTAGQVTIGPTDGNFETEISYLEPGDGDHLGVGGSGSAVDDYPFVWEADTIYMTEVSVSAPSAAAEDQPVDVIQVGMDPPTWENVMLNSVTRGDATMHNIGMPKAGTPQTYVSFFRSGPVTISGVPDFERLRPRLQILNATPLVFNGQAQNNDPYTVHGITVKKVTVGQ
jgi:hypothetical protein